MNALAFDVNAACSGFLFAWNTADAYLRTGLAENALVIGSEVCPSWWTVSGPGAAASCSETQCRAVVVERCGRSPGRWRNTANALPETERMQETAEADTASRHSGPGTASDGTGGGSCNVGEG